MISQAYRDVMGRVVREAWVEWAKEQPSPKASWLVQYDELDESEKEADRRIAEAVVDKLLPELSPVVSEAAAQLKKIIPIIVAVSLVLQRHGLRLGDSETQWSGTPEQQSALAALHRHLLDFVGDDVFKEPPRPSVQIYRIVVQ